LQVDIVQIFLGIIRKLYLKQVCRIDIYAHGICVSRCKRNEALLAARGRRVIIKLDAQTIESGGRADRIGVCIVIGAIPDEEFS